MSNYAHVVPGSARYTAVGLKMLRDKYAADDSVVSLINQLDELVVAGRAMRKMQQTFRWAVLQEDARSSISLAPELTAAELAFDNVLKKTD